MLGRILVLALPALSYCMVTHSPYLAPRPSPFRTVAVVPTAFLPNSATRLLGVDVQMARIALGEFPSHLSNALPRYGLQAINTQQRIAAPAFPTQSKEDGYVGIPRPTYNRGAIQAIANATQADAILISVAELQNKDDGSLQSYQGVCQGVAFSYAAVQVLLFDATGELLYATPEYNGAVFHKVEANMDRTCRAIPKTRPEINEEVRARAAYIAQIIFGSDTK